MNERSTRNDEFRRGENYVYRLTVGEHLLVGLHANSDQPLYALTPTGALLWERLATWASVEQLAESLVREYEVSKEEAVADVREFIEQLQLLDAVDLREASE